MATVKHLLGSKGKTVWSVTPDTKTLEALKLMADKDIGALLVMDGEKLVGIISERDFARRLAASGSLRYPSTGKRSHDHECLLRQS